MGSAELKTGDFSVRCHEVLFELPISDLLKVFFYKRDQLWLLLVVNA
jgi:hypothetical protein